MMAPSGLRDREPLPITASVGRATAVIVLAARA